MKAIKVPCDEHCEWHEAKGRKEAIKEFSKYLAGKPSKINWTEWKVKAQEIKK